MFFFGKRSAASKPPQPVRAADQKRRAYRASLDFPVCYAIDGRPGMRTALAHDLSSGGLRLIGDEDIPDGAILALRFTLPNDIIRGIEIEKQIEEFRRGQKIKKRIMVPAEPFAEMAIRGRTVIGFLNLRRRKFAHGVQFLDVDDRTREEIQRFIHVWQIKQLRERADARF